MFLRVLKYTTEIDEKLYEKLLKASEKLESKLYSEGVLPADEARGQGQHGGLQGPAAVEPPVGE